MSELVQLRRVSRDGADDASADAREIPDVPGPGQRRVYLETYGCQMNVADSDLMLGLLAGGGYARTDDPKEADLILINTCAVREKAEEKVFARASMLSYDKARPDVVLGITGCMAEHLKDKVRARLQLNVRNIFENGRLQTVAVNPDGSPYAFRIIDPRQFILSATFNL